MTIQVKLAEDTIQQIQSLAKDSGFSKTTLDGVLKIAESLSNQENIDADLAQGIGQYFYYYSQIDEILSKIIRSLLPELDISIMGLESSFDKNSFLKKLELIKSLTPNSEQLKFFPLLKKLNVVRNELAHVSPQKLNFSKLNDGLSSVFREAFALEEELFQKITKSVNYKHEISVTVKIILVSKIFLELFANIETLGKKEDKLLRLFEALRNLSSLYVRRRFSILAYQIQTNTKSADAPDHFKEMEVFNSAIKEFGDAIKTMFASKD
tara:strand:+ start:781 stop:1581 length:801 start_codon:yes stop_codon:yes gene_type:complete